MALSGGEKKQHAINLTVKLAALLFRIPKQVRINIFVRMPTVRTGVGGLLYPIQANSWKLLKYAATPSFYMSSSSFAFILLFDAVQTKQSNNRNAQNTSM